MKLLIFALLIFAAGVSSAQDESCSNGVPCGPIPWPMPVLPALESPTPFIPSADPSVPTPTPAPTSALLNPVIPATPDLPMGNLGDVIATQQAGAYATVGAVVIDGTTVPIEDQAIELVGSASDLFGIAKGIGSVSFGPLTPLVTVALFGFGLFLSVKVLVLALPALAIFIGIIRKIVTLILDFLPL